MTIVSFLSHRYDIKGCEVGRWTNPDTDGRQIIKVLKDNNFEGQHIALGKCPLLSSVNAVHFRCLVPSVGAAEEHRGDCNQCQ